LRWTSASFRQHMRWRGVGMRNVGVSCGIITFIWGLMTAPFFFAFANYMLKVMSMTAVPRNVFVCNMMTNKSLSRIYTIRASPGCSTSTSQPLRDHVHINCMHLQFRGHILPSVPALYRIWGVESGDRNFDWQRGAFCLKSNQPCQLCYGNHVNGNPRLVMILAAASTAPINGVAWK
jgi:hypothetical protein